MFVDFYHNFSRDSTSSANEVVQFYGNKNILKAQKLKISHSPLGNKIFYYFAQLGFGTAEYNVQPMIEKKKSGVGGWWSVVENGRKSRKMKSIFPDMSEKIMACMIIYHLKVSK